MWTSADLLTFTKEIIKGDPHFFIVWYDHLPVSVFKEEYIDLLKFCSLACFKQWIIPSLWITDTANPTLKLREPCFMMKKTKNKISLLKISFRFFCLFLKTILNNFTFFSNPLRITQWTKESNSGCPRSTFGNVRKPLAFEVLWGYRNGISS